MCTVASVPRDNHGNTRDKTASANAKHSSTGPDLELPIPALPVYLRVTDLHAETLEEETIGLQGDHTPLRYFGR